MEQDTTEKARAGTAIDEDVDGVPLEEDAADDVDGAPLRFPSFCLSFCLSLCLSFFLSFFLSYLII